MWGREEGRRGETRRCFISFSAPIPLIEIPQRHVHLKTNFSRKSSQRNHVSLFNICRQHLVQVLSGVPHLTNSHAINMFYNWKI